MARNNCKNRRRIDTLVCHAMRGKPLQSGTQSVTINRVDVRKTGEVCLRDCEGEALYSFSRHRVHVETSPRGNRILLGGGRSVFIPTSS